MLTLSWKDDRDDRGLAAAGTVGCALTLVILAASVLVRLNTRFEAGEAVSLLPAAVESAVRIAHRIAAMGVGLATGLAFVMVVRGPRDPQRIAVVGAIVALVLLLAVLGRHAPGYRHDWITVAHVVGGTALACAFWRLRHLSRARESRDPRIDLAAAAALVLLLAVAGVGAATAAAALHGHQSFGPLHLLLATASVCMAWIVAWRRRARPWLMGTLANLALLQGVLGFAQLGQRSPALGTVHAMVAVLLALLLVSCLAREDAA